MISDFLLSPDDKKAFVLCGYAGTGKTTLISALVRTMELLGRKTVLLAPTGRAAKVFSSYSGKSAYTIHKWIYRQKSILDASQFILRNGKWVVYEEPDTVTFTGIQWNDIGYGIFEGKKGVLLAFDKNLSATQSEIDGGLMSVNLASSASRSRKPA